MSAPKKIFVIGGTGAQGIPIVRSLVSDGAYAVRVLTRDPSSARAQELLALAPERVELVRGSFTSMADLRAGFAGCWGAFVNLDGFVTGEQGEAFWAIRAWELAVQTPTLRFFVYGNLEYALRLGGYDEALRSSHMDGKGRVGEWVLWQNERNRGMPWYHGMGAALLTTSAYADMTVSAHTSMSPRVETGADGEAVATWRVPLGVDGAVPHVALDDCGPYVRWLFDHPERADGMDLAVAIEHVHYDDMAAAFARVTGHPARFIDTDADEYWREGPMASVADRPAGYEASLDDPATMTTRGTFTGFWNTFRRSGHNKGVLKRDYALLDEIYPGRVSTMEEFFRLEDEKARKEGSSLWERVQNLRPVLKLTEDYIKMTAEAGQKA